MGRKTRSVIVCDSDHVVLSAVQAETIRDRIGESLFGVEGDE